MTRTAEQKEKYRLWRQEDRRKRPEKYKKIRKLRYQRDGERIRERARGYRNNNPEKSLWISAKRRARLFGHKFTLKIEDIIIPSHCPVLGIPLISGRYGTGKRHEDSPSIDRRDNSKGYTPENIVIVSVRANRIKSDATSEELRRIANFYG